jgi:hypothetical protein
MRTYCKEAGAALGRFSAYVGSIALLGAFVAKLLGMPDADAAQRAWAIDHQAYQAFALIAPADALECGCADDEPEPVAIQGEPGRSALETRLALRGSSLGQTDWVKAPHEIELRGRFGAD